VRELAQHFLDLLWAGQAESDLRVYSRAAWGLLEASTQLVWGWHMDAIVEHLQVVPDEIDKLLITVPARMGKSTLVSVMWPTWHWIQHPETRWLFSSYALSLSIRDSVRCRRIIESPWYQERWGDRYRLTTDQNQKMRFDNDRSG
jgi:hypothetical protein